jgi:hypothetical protein
MITLDSVEKQIVKPMSAFRASNLLLKGAKGGTKPTWAIIENHEIIDLSNYLVKSAIVDKSGMK